MAFSSSRKEIQLKPQIEVPLGPLPLDIPRVKAVSFNDDVVETSIGGTRTVARMKLEPLASIAINRNTSVQFESSLSQKTTGCISSVATISPVSETKNSITEMENKENMENSEETKTSKNKPQSQKANNGKDVSPMGRQTKAVPLLKEFEKFTPDIVRRTTQEYLDQVPDAFVTPPQYQMRRHTLETKIFETPDCYRAVQMETPHKLSMFDLVSGTDDSITEEADGEDSCSVTVAVRVRPYSQREMSDVNVKRVVSMSGNETTVTTESGNVHRFAFDFSFWSFDRVSGEFADQGHIYTSLAQPLLGKAFEGYNTCLFAYGQTGSGKSYSIMGHGQDTGIIPRFCAELFSRAARASSKDKVKISVEISFFEIYNEKIHDLLASCKEKNGKKATLKVREHPVLGPYVEGLSTFVVNSFEDVEGWITLGTKNRATAATGMNDKSSRSHSVFTIVLTQTKTERVENKDHDHSITSKINLVDLAGSERQSQAQTTGERLREGANINKSLLTLGKVISLLAERSASSKKRKIFIPYRDSVLTWLLKESLGGNSKTAMIATISPSHHHVEETLSTLRYARQTRSIVNVVRINEDPKAKIIRELRAEIEKLRSQSGTMNDDAHMAGLAEVAMLREKLMSKEKEMDELCKSWQERLRQAETRKQEESKKLEKSGVAAVKVDNQQPNLVNLNEDPQLSELLLYVIKPGQTRVGRKHENSVHDIQLSGALIADNHCIINNVEGIVNITPIGDAPIYVNGNLVSEPTILHHADRVILGGDHYFRFNHPMEVKTTKRKHGTTSLEAKDFEFARQELLQTQEAKLQAELEEAQKVAQAKMEEELERARRRAEFELSQQRSGYEDKLADLEKTLKQQGLEVQKAVESKQEASSLIAELRRQKLVLEQEILASRKRHQLEAEAAEKINLNPDGIKSRILELLQNERTRVAVQLEKAQQHRDEIVTSSSIRLRQQGAEGLSGKAALKRKDLCKVALLLREANKISHFLKKNLVFSREDVEDESSEAESNGLQILIKVTNTQHRIFTHWTVAKLEEKIIQMRDLYQNDGDIPAEDDEVFNDPEDSWEKENLSPCNSPTSGVFRRSPISSIASHSTQLTSSSFVSPALKRVSFGSPSRADRDVSTYRVCRKMALSVMDQLNALCFEETVVDKILWDCYVLKSSVSSLLVEPGNSSCVSGTKQLSCSPIQLVYGLHRLATHCSLWAESFDQDSPTMHSQLTEHIRSIGIHVSHLLQGYETDLSSLVQESAGKLSEEVLSLCRTCGQLSLVTKTRVLRLEQFNQDSAASQPSPEVCRAFLAGCDKLLDHTLEDGIQSVQHSETQAKSLSETLTSSQEMSEVCQDVSQTVFCTKALLRSCQEVQVEVDASLTEVSSLSSDLQHHCHASYCRLQALLALISSLAEAAHLLVQCTEPVIKGNNQDLQGIHSCAEMIHRKSLLLLNCSCSSINSLSPDSLLDPSHISSQFWPRNSTFDDSLHKSGDNALNTGSSFMLTDSQVEHLNFAAQEVLSASQSLMNRIKKLMGTDCTSTIPASKRRMFSVSSGK